ncbi:MAG: hypothetical protein KF900_03945 [Bacteroidetes bacterium]|nr:hypothetical protein [Bacteroidota bacterium]
MQHITQNIRNTNATSVCKKLIFGLAFFAATVTVKAQIGWPWPPDLPVFESPYQPLEEYIQSSRACYVNSVPWYEGGNTVAMNPATSIYAATVNLTPNVIGPCNNVDFILQANSKKTVFLKTNGNVGIGIDNDSPSAVLDVSEFAGAGNPSSHLKIYGDADGSIESTGNMHLYAASSSLFQVTFGEFGNPNGNNHNVLTIDGTTNDISLNGTGNVSGDLNVNGYTSVHSGLGVTGGFGVNGSAAITGAASIGGNANVGGAANITGTANIGGAANIAGKTIIGNQQGATNSATLNINVNGGNAIEVFDQASSGSGNAKVNFRVKANGIVYSREVNVQLTNFPDYVFNKDYKLPSLESLDEYIKQNKHLPNVPTAKEVETNGANLGELSRIQMEKIEELTLYVIELKKEIEALKKQQSKK